MVGCDRCKKCRFPVIVGSHCYSLPSHGSGQCGEEESRWQEISYLGKDLGRLSMKPRLLWPERTLRIIKHCAHEDIGVVWVAVYCLHFLRLWGLRPVNVRIIGWYKYTITVVEVLIIPALTWMIRATDVIPKLLSPVCFFRQQASVHGMASVVAIVYMLIL